MLRIVIVAILLLSVFTGAHAGGRVALVVGVSNYEHAAHLANTLNDARDMTAALRRLGFDVEMLLDPSRPAFETAVRRYGDRSVGADVSLFHYSGHALEAVERNWLLPATANLATERDLRFEAIDLNTIHEQTDGAAKVSIVFLDACRDNPFARRLSVTGRNVSPRGLGRVEISAGGVLVAFSTAPGQVALDSISAKRNSPFTAALLHHIETPGLEIKTLLAHVTKDVVEETKGKQRPWQNSSLEGDFYFLPPVDAATPSAQSLVTLEGVFWDSIKVSRNPADFNAYLAKFPKGVFVELAQNRLTTLQQETTSGSQYTNSSKDTAPGPKVANAPQVVPTPQSLLPVPSAPAVPQVYRDEVPGLLARVRDLMSVGDILAARLVLRRMYEHGDPQAALELGATYDPLVLKRLNSNFVNFYADTAQARDWYRRAAQLGATDTAQRIKELTLPIH